MRGRIVLLTVLIVGGFIFLTWRGPESPLRRALEPHQTPDGPVWSSPDVAHGAGLGVDELNNIEIYRMANQATVNITSTVLQQDWFRGVYQAQAAGSGFVIDSDGRILTNNHVVSGSNKIQVVLADQSSYTAELVDRDPPNDLALIKIQPKKKIAFLRLGDSEKIQVGQKVLAIGNPFRLSGTLTVGVVSAIGRQIAGDNQRILEGLIQTDAAINHGNSGGPLLDSQGAVIGINTAILGEGNIGIGFAMPINKAKTMLDDYSAGRKYRKPRLGVEVIPVSGDLAQALELPTRGGLLIQVVARGSAAAEAGLRGAKQEVVVGNYTLGIGGDLIMAIEGKPVDRSDAISIALAKHRAGDTIELTVYRDGKQMTVKVKLGEAPDDRS
jgi:S1-C subfamily serine protease